MSIVPEYTNIPGVDVNNNFPPVIRQALARAEEVHSEIANSSVVHQGLAASAPIKQVSTDAVNAIFEPGAALDSRIMSANISVDSLQKPVIIASRGGGYKVYPENSYEGVKAAVESRVVPHLSVQFLSMDTPVACEDATANRTMMGITGPLNVMTVPQWRTGMINSPVRGGYTGRPVTISEILDLFGGSSVIFLDLPDTVVSTQADIVAQMVLARALGRSVLIGTNQIDIAVSIQALGIDAVYKPTNPSAETPAVLYSQGLRWVSLDRTTSSALVTSFSDGGLKVLLREISTKAQVNALPSGYFGYRTIDPLAHTNRLPRLSNVGWENGGAWSDRRVYGRTNGTDTVYSDRHDTLKIEGRNLLVDNRAAGAQTFIDLRHMLGGMVDSFITVTAKFVFLRRADSQTRGAGFVIFKNTVDPEADFYDSAKAGQTALVAWIQRDGSLGSWKYVNGDAGSVAFPSTTGSTVAAAGAVGQATLRLEMSTSWFGLSHIESGRTHGGAFGFTGPLTPLLRVFGGEVMVQDVSIEKYAA